MGIDWCVCGSSDRGIEELTGSFEGPAWPCLRTASTDQKFMRKLFRPRLAACILRSRGCKAIGHELSSIQHRTALRRAKAMFCSSCGGAVAQGLNLCNHCGATLMT